MEKVNLLSPDYYDKFNCIGSTCEDTCCYGWTVPVDEKTYKKYRKLKNSVLRSNLDRYIKRNRKDPSHSFYAKLILNEDYYCPFLDNNKLCAIQKDMGIEYLSKVCKLYPREANYVNNVLERFMTISCPEAARTILLNKNIMEFNEDNASIDDINENNQIKKVINPNNIYSDAMNKYLWPLRIFCITLMQNRNYSLEDRLIILGMFIKKLRESEKNKDYDKIHQIIDEYNKNIADETIKEVLHTIPVNNTLQMKLIKEFNDQRFMAAFSPNSQAYIDCVAEFLNGIKYTAEENIEDISARYIEAIEKYYKPYMKEHEYIFENYIVNYIFKEAFPINENKNVFDQYVKLILNFSILKMLLIGMAAYNNRIDEDLIIRLMYSYSRAVEHNNVFFENTFRVFKESGYDTLAYMTILIKN